MQKEYILAYDFGTTAVKAVLVDFEGQVLCNHTRDYPLIQLHSGWAEQEPEVLWQAVCTSTKGVMEKSGVNANNIKGIVFAAPWKNIIPIDKDGNLLRNSIIWMDGRASEQASKLNEKAGFFVGTGQEYWPRLMWVKENEPEIWDKAEVIMGINTFLKWKATGEITTDPSDDFFHAFNPRIQEYFDKVIAAAGLDEDRKKFPAVKLSTEKVGETTEKAAFELGLRPGIPVFGGFGDLSAITVGTGCCRTGDAHIYFGTSSWLLSLIPERVSDFAPLYSIFDPNNDCAIFALQTGCLAFDWALSQFYRAERDILQGDIFEFVDKQISSIEAGSMNMIATHWLNGELPPLAAKNAKAVFYNVTSNHDRRHMVRAIMESVCYTHRRYKEKYESFTGKKLDSIRVVGGGAVSDVWMQILADVLQIPICIPENPRLTGAMGAYYCAMIGLGHLESYNAIYDTVKISKVFNPNKDNFDVYNKLYNIYLKLYPSLSSLYDDINGVY